MPISLPQLPFEGGLPVKLNPRETKSRRRHPPPQLVIVHPAPQPTNEIVLENHQRFVARWTGHPWKLVWMLVVALARRRMVRMITLAVFSLLLATDHVADATVKNPRWDYNIEYGPER